MGRQTDAKGRKKMSYRIFAGKENPISIRKFLEGNLFNGY